MLRCQTDREYISKVHCIRVAFQVSMILMFSFILILIKWMFNQANVFLANFRDSNFRIKLKLCAVFPIISLLLLLLCDKI